MRDAGSSGASSGIVGSNDALSATTTYDAATLAAGFSPAVLRDLETLRNATRPYHDLKAAQAAGYPMPMPACVADSTMGGMGRHYYDRALADSTLDIARPEMLIYAPLPDGNLKFVAVEYIVPYRILPSTAKAPRLLGQEFRPHEQFKYWYLHVWAWEKNAAGLFADWNPKIRC
jgi:hypothetical protein